MDSEYKVGALADLISDGGGSSENKNLPMASLFTTKRKQKEATTSIKQKQKEAAEDSGTNNAKVKKSSKKPKRMKKVKEDDDDDEEEDDKDSKDAEEAKARKAQEMVKREDEKEEKERKRDPEQEERTVFVGNLPVSATKKQAGLLTDLNTLAQGR